MFLFVQNCDYNVTMGSTQQKQIQQNMSMKDHRYVSITNYFSQFLNVFKSFKAVSNHTAKRKEQRYFRDRNEFYVNYQFVY